MEVKELAKWVSSWSDSPIYIKELRHEFIDDDEDFWDWFLKAMNPHVEFEDGTYLFFYEHDVEVLPSSKATFVVRNKYDQRIFFYKID